MIRAQTVLELLVVRLETRVGELGSSDFGAWEGEEGELNKVAASGRLHFAEAVALARKALRSGDDQQMADAALLCASLERTGNEVEQRSRRKAGGRARGVAQNAASTSVWAPYVQQYQELIAKGIGAPTARRMVTKRMERDKFTLPRGGGFPNARTIRIWMPAAKRK